MEFLKFFIQFGIVNTLYGSLFGRPEKFGVRGVYVDDGAIVGGPHGALLPAVGPGQAINKFFKHTYIPYPDYDFAVIDASNGYYPALKKFYQSCKRVIPGGYILIKNTQKACRRHGSHSIKFIDEIKRADDYEVLEFPDNGGMALVRVRDKKDLKRHNVKPLNAGFWVAIGVLSGLVLSEVYKGKTK